MKIFSALLVVTLLHANSVKSQSEGLQTFIDILFFLPNLSLNIGSDEEKGVFGTFSSEISIGKKAMPGGYAAVHLGREDCSGYLKTGLNYLYLNEKRSVCAPLTGGLFYKVIFLEVGGFLNFNDKSGYVLRTGLQIPVSRNFKIELSYGIWGNEYDSVKSFGIGFSTTFR